MTRLHVTASKVHVDSFHVNNVKMGIDARSLRCGKVHVDNGPVLSTASMIRELARRDCRSAALRLGERFGKAEDSSCGKRSDEWTVW